MCRRNTQSKKHILVPWATLLLFSLIVSMGHAQVAELQPQHAWTAESALEQLRLYPRDPYLQYVFVQLATRNGDSAQATEQLRQLNGRPSRMGRASDVNLFSIFSGALAIQESLQLDAMTGEETRGRFPPGSSPQTARIAAKLPLASLSGPTVKSHPWQEMLAGRTPNISPLALCIPEDYLFIKFRSVGKLLDALQMSDDLGAYVAGQTHHAARTQAVTARLQRQLAIDTSDSLRPIYDAVVDELAITSSDLFLSEGTDVTLIVQFKQPDVFRARMDQLLSLAEKGEARAQRSTGVMLDVPFTHVSTPDRTVHVFSAYPRPDLHVRTNSRIALERTLEAIAGKTSAGRAVRRLGDSLEFSFIRTIMPEKAAEEDGFVYMSDPFIRKLVGPQAKLCQRRRLICYNHLRMIGHASLMHSTETGKLPASLDQMLQSQCLPKGFGAEGDLACPDGGRYELTADGLTGICSHHGRCGALIPCCEIPISTVTQAEANQYKTFVDNYNQYWRTFFDPIAVRIQLTPKKQRIETVVLPLIDNSVYTNLAQVLGGTPEMLDELPVPDRNIFSVGLKFQKQRLFEMLGLQQVIDELATTASTRRWNFLDPKLIEGLHLKDFIQNGIGDQISLHLCDADPLVDFNVASFLGLATGSFSGRSGGFNIFGESGAIALLAMSINAPLYVAVPVENAQSVDNTLQGLDNLLARLARQNLGGAGGFFEIQQDFYQVDDQRKAGVRSYAFRFGPLKWRFFWARVGNGLYVASKPFIINDLIRLGSKGQPPTAAEHARRDRGPTAHGMIRLRPLNWNQVVPQYKIGWAENQRLACLHNLGPLSSLSRALHASHPAGFTQDKAIEHLHSLVYRVLDTRFYCPCHGQYHISPDGNSVSCSVHGSALSPRQPLEVPQQSRVGALIEKLKDVSLALTFLEDGLHAVVTVERE